MGMFDTIIFDEKYDFRFTKKTQHLLDQVLNDDGWDREMQTKDFITCWMDVYMVDKKGQLWLKNKDSGRRKRVKYTGTINCYNLITNNQLDHDVWLEIQLLFADGTIKNKPKAQAIAQDNSTRIKNFEQFEHRRKQYDAQHNKLFYKFVYHVYKRPLRFIFDNMIKLFNNMSRACTRVRLKL